MKVISIGTDRKIFEENSAVRQRMIEYSKYFEELHMIVATKNIASQKDLPLKIKISDTIFVYSTHSSSRLLFFYDVIKIVKNIFKNRDSRDFIISAQDPFEMGIAGGLIKLFYGLPLHIQIHTDLANKYFRESSLLNKIRFMMSEFTLKYSDRVRVVSERIRKSVEAFSKNIDVLPIKMEILQGQSLEFEIKKPFPFTLIMVCRLEKEKNIETVLKAIKDLENKNIGLCLVGDGSEKNNIQKMAQNMGILEQIYFAGWQDDLGPYYKMADAFVSASLFEGYGVSTVEAAYFGLPLILSETGITGEVFKNDSAFICDAKDPECFSQSILRVYEDKNLTQKMGETAKVGAQRHLAMLDDYYKKYADSVIRTADNYKKRNFISRVFEFKKTAFNSIMLIRYFLCGITSAATNIIAIYIFTDGFGIWYLYSSIMAFFISLLISFVLQKFVVFKDTETNEMRYQFSKFFIAAILGVITNTFLISLCVEILGIWYIFSQIIAGFFVMIQNFLLYKFFIFKKS